MFSPCVAIVSIRKAGGDSAVMLGSISNEPGYRVSSRRYVC